MSLKPKHPRLLSCVNGHFLLILSVLNWRILLKYLSVFPFKVLGFHLHVHPSLPSFCFSSFTNPSINTPLFIYLAVFVKPLFLLKLSFETLHCTLSNGHACVGYRIVYSWKSSHSTIFCKLLSHVPCWLVVQISHLHFSKKMTANIYKNVNVQSSTFTKM